MAEDEIVFDLSMEDNMEDMIEDLETPLTENEVEILLENQVAEYLENDLSDHIETLGLRKEIDGDIEKIIAPHNHSKSDIDKYEYLNDKEKEEYYIQYKYIIDVVAKQYASPIQKVYFEDLVDIGTVGFVKALNAFKLSMHVKFTSFASVVIRNEILDWLDAKNNRTVKEFNTLDQPIEGGDGDHEVNYIASDVNLEEDFQRQLEIQTVHLILDELSKKISERDMFILKSYYELDGFEKRTQAELAMIFDCTQPNIQFILTQLKKRIREIYEEKHREAIVGKETK